MTYENKVHYTNYLTIKDYDVLTCLRKIVNIHIFNLNNEVWVTFTLGRAYFPRPFNAVKV